MGEYRTDHVQRKLQPIRFLGVDRHADALCHGQLREFQYARRQLGMHACAVGDVVARMDCGQLDGDGGRVEDIRPRSSLAQRTDRIAVSLHVARGIGFSKRRLAQHVVGIAVGCIVLLRGAILRFLDGAAHDELMAHDAHGLAHGQADHRLAGAPHQSAQGTGEIGPGFLGQLHQATGEHQAPGRGIHEQRFAGTDVLLPVGIAELVANQLVRGFRIGHAQQGFGHAHQQHAFLAGKVVLAHEGLDSALLVGLGAHLAHQIRGAREHLLALDRTETGLAQQVIDRFGFIA